MSSESISNLINNIDENLKNVHTQSLDISFNELLDMVVSKELDISPDYQRVFRWSEGAQSRFIESLLLEMPVPPIYVVEVEDNKKLLIDGLQRLSSYLHFRGVLDAPHLNINYGDKLILSDCDIVESLNGITYDDLGTALQIKLKRSFVRVEVVRKSSNAKFKYHMFKRLNTGGTLLTDQQLRNCTIRLLDDEFNDFIIRLSGNNDFQTTIENITEEQKLGAYDQELVLRFFTFKNNRAAFKHDIRDFLTQYMEEVSDPEHPREFDYNAQERDFNRTFEVLNAALGNQSFSRANNTRTKLNTMFVVYQFESFTLGIQKYLDRLDISSLPNRDQLKELFKNIKLDEDFISLTTGGGKNTPNALNARVSFVEQKIEEFLGNGY
ncbi:MULTISPECIES: DUF262 domain-containing protein [Acinetobacter calcoaceticus/baumannii complex]|uniref:GmrSD restriction endonucleases N-terminal domain-containing protein n=2 Tax=Acinetobacter TaxID=469 RepID=A0A7U7KGM9_ACIBA|nr:MULTISPECIES: DUF262 domain-containing protein [Acinetobacter calcoaceticus/baumannii complex]EXI11507.1 hypothetical protein J604_2319 [Acinetobacter sp. 694762]MBU3140440.1 DUF262 domain-containing protein [Acinetobacter nosocomialis]MCF1298310.1 DUF262 domain-containing protein [Acinetobacter baumannii]CDM73411.1 hypothetical protein ABP630_2988 [Acinetobacter baumannii P630]CRL95691.1 hypothetical protein ABCIP7010_2987 [Acinetobacter baumannii]